MVCYLLIANDCELANFQTAAVQLAAAQAVASVAEWTLFGK
jgi:hypothetical protein